MKPLVHEKGCLEGGCFIVGSDWELPPGFRSAHLSKQFEQLTSTPVSDVITLDIHKTLQVPGEDRCLEPLKAEPREMFRGSVFSRTSSVSLALDV